MGRKTSTSMSAFGDLLTARAARMYRDWRAEILIGLQNNMQAEFQTLARVGVAFSCRYASA